MVSEAPSSTGSYEPRSNEDESSAEGSVVSSSSKAAEVDSAEEPNDVALRVEYVNPIQDHPDGLIQDHMDVSWFAHRI
jgi:hypothetical protein